MARQKKIKEEDEDMELDEDENLDEIEDLLD